MTKIKTHREIDAAAKLIADWRSMMIVHVIYEQGPLRYGNIASQLELSPTILSEKLSQLTKVGLLLRNKNDGSKEVIYEASKYAKDMVDAYHLLEKVNDSLRIEEDE